MWISGVDAARLEMRLEAAEKVCEAVAEVVAANGPLWYPDLTEPLDAWRELLANPPRLVPIPGQSPSVPADPEVPTRSLAESVQAMVEDGFPCGSPAADEWFEIMQRRLAEET
jgi:hypothetical protein